MPPSRAKAIRKALGACQDSKSMLESAKKEWAMAHDSYNDFMTSQPKTGRNSGFNVEQMRLRCEASYEALLDALRLHSDNMAHVAALRGTL